GLAWRVQGGWRAGTSGDAGGGVKLEPVVTALAYDDVKISGGTLAVALAPVTAPTDQDKVFGLLDLKLNADYGGGLSAYVEGEVRGRTGVVGTAVRAGIRKSFQGRENPARTEKKIKPPLLTWAADGPAALGLRPTNCCGSPHRRLA